MGMKGGCEVPGQEILDFVDGMIRDPRQHRSELEFRIESVAQKQVALYFVGAPSRPMPYLLFFVWRASPRESLCVCLG
jgi:hypothetical protein